MLRQQRINQISYFFFVLVGLFIIVLSGCAQQDQKSSTPTTEKSDTDQQETVTQQTVLKPAPETEKSTPDEKPEIDPANAIAIIETAKGNIEFEFFAADAPQTSKTFIKNAMLGYYQNESFHRVEELIIQAGTSFVDDILPIEKSEHSLEKGTVLMAKEEGATVSDADEFFICKETIALDEDYTTLGKVINGLEVLDSIEQDDKIVNITIRERDKE